MSHTTPLQSSDAQKIVALLKSSVRANGKRLLSVPDAVRILRANGTPLVIYTDGGSANQPLTMQQIRRGIVANGLALPGGRK